MLTKICSLDGFFLTTFWLESKCLVGIGFSVERARDDGMNEKANCSTLNHKYIQLQALSCYSPRQGYSRGSRLEILHLLKYFQKNLC